MSAPLYPSQDGPGARAAVEVMVRVDGRTGPDRSTGVVRCGGEPAILHEVRPHGAEADSIGAVVEAAVSECVKLFR